MDLLKLLENKHQEHKMPINVSEVVNDFVKNNPKATENQKQGMSTASAFFSSIDSDNLNVSTILNSNSNRADINAAIEKIDPTVANKSVAPLQKQQKSTNAGPDQAKKENFDRGVNRAILDLSDSPIGAPTIKVNDKIPMLLQNDVKALMCQIGYIESDWDTYFSDAPRYGRYGTHDKTLMNYGYKDKEGTWVGKDGILTSIEFTFDSNVQDRILEKFIQDQYKALIKNGGIQEYDTKETIAGMIAVAYQFQDASPSVENVSASFQTILSNGSLVSGDMTGLVSESGILTSQLDNTLNAGISSLAVSGTAGQSASILNETSSTMQTALTESNLSQDLGGAMTPGLVTALNAGDATGARAELSKSTLSDKFKSAAESIGKNLKPVTEKISGMSDSIKKKINDSLKSSATATEDYKQIVAQKVNVSKLRSAAEDLASFIPAEKAKQWRLTGKEKDSKGRSGSLYFNAGKYAITLLAADIPMPEPEPAATEQKADIVADFKSVVIKSYNSIVDFLTKIQTIEVYNQYAPEIASTWKSLINRTKEIADSENDANLKTELDTWVAPYRENLNRLNEQTRARLL